jgi:hypothetical protein
LSPVYAGSDADLAVASKKLMKKDSVTRLKAFGEVLAVLEDRGSNVIYDFLPHFVYIYLRLATDDERRVREQISNVLTGIASVDKRALGPFMKTLIGPWWALTADPCAEVAAAASAAFKKAIPPKKRAQVLVYLSSHILQHVNRNLSQKPDTLSDMAVCTREEAEERFERVVGSSITCTGRLVTALSPEENHVVLTGTAATPSAAATSTEDSGGGGAISLTVAPLFTSEDAAGGAGEGSHFGYADVLKESFWKQSTSKSAAVRAAAYKTIETVCTHIPAAVPTAVASLSRLSAIVANFLLERHPRNLNGMFTAFLSYVNAFPACWQQQEQGAPLSVDRVLVPRLRELLRCDAASEATLGFLLPILGALPAAMTSMQTMQATDAADAGTEAEAEAGTEGESGGCFVAICGLLEDIVAMGEQNSFPPQLLATADLTVLECATLLLLRRTPASTLQPADHPVSDADTASTSTAAMLTTTEPSASVEEKATLLCSLAVRSIALLLQSTAEAVQKRQTAHVHINHHPSSSSSSPSLGLSGAAAELYSALRRSLVQLCRASLQERSLTAEQWGRCLWAPLGRAMGALVRQSVSENLLPILRLTTATGDATVYGKKSGSGSDMDRGARVDEVEARGWIATVSEVQALLATIADVVRLCVDSCSDSNGAGRSRGGLIATSEAHASPSVPLSVSMMYAELKQTATSYLLMETSTDRGSGSGSVSASQDISAFDMDAAVERAIVANTTASGVFQSQSVSSDSLGGTGGIIRRCLDVLQSLLWAELLSSVTLATATASALTVPLSAESSNAGSGAVLSVLVSDWLAAVTDLLSVSESLVTRTLLDKVAELFLRHIAAVRALGRLLGPATDSPSSSSSSLACQLLLSYCVRSNSLAAANIVLSSGVLQSAEQPHTQTQPQPLPLTRSEERLVNWALFVVDAVLSTSPSSSSQSAAEDENDEEEAETSTPTSSASADVDSSVAEALARSSPADRVGFVALCAFSHSESSDTGTGTGSLHLSQYTRAFDRALAAWQTSRSKAGLWVVLTVVAWTAAADKRAAKAKARASLRARGNNVSGDKTQARGTVAAKEERPESESESQRESESSRLAVDLDQLGFPEMLLAVYFSRTREQKRLRGGSIGGNGNDTDTDTGTGFTTLAITGGGAPPLPHTLPLLTSWDDVKTSLLPLLPASVLAAFGRRVAASLSSHLGMVEEEDIEETGAMSVPVQGFQLTMQPTITATLQPRKVRFTNLIWSLTTQIHACS